MRKIYFIGSGMGDEDLLTKESEKIMLSCDEIYAFDRLSELFKALRGDIIKCSYGGLLELLDRSSSKTIGVLVSGDAGFFSIASTLAGKLENRYEVQIICGISSVQYFCAKLKISYENIKVISLHGRDQNILGALAYNRYTFILTGGSSNASDILKKLLRAELCDIKVTAGEKLSMPGEKIISGTVAELSGCTFDSLTVLLFENENPVQNEASLFDSDLIRDKTPMTKQEVRWVSVNYLNISPDDIIYDIGAGTGSVSIEMARKAYNGVVYAIEKERGAYDLLLKNMRKLRAFNVIPVFGNAVEEIEKLPAPNKVFIGGSCGELSRIVSYLDGINSRMKFVINAITLETLSEAITILKKLKISIQVTCINCAKNKSAGEYNLMMANNPVYIIAGGKNAE